MNKFKSEFEMYDKIGDYLKKHDYDVLYSVHVGNFHPREFDIVGVHKDNLISIEVKLNNFNRTVEQAITRLFYSDHVMVAFPEKYANFVQSKYREELVELGIGLMSVDKTAIIKLKPQKSKVLSYARKNKLIEIVNSNLKLKRED